MGARQAVELVERRAIAGGADVASLAQDYEERHLPVQVAAAAGHVDEIVEPGDTRQRLAELLA
jgi:acetyl-CoA carboxylase carboxyltransferase component